MAEQQQEHGIDLDQSHFCCSVCLEMFKEPVTIPCGHTYCKVCIEGCWDQEEQRGKYSCPQCREEFSQRPLLRKNNILAETFKSLSISCENPDVCAGPFACPKRSFKAVTDALSQLKGDIKRLLNEKWPGISRTDCCPLTLDQNTVSEYLSISQENRRATSEKNANCYFDTYSRRWMNVGKNIRQVLYNESLSGRCYWEVTWSGSTWSVAVSYKDISQPSSYDSEFGNDNKSWSLDCSQQGNSFRHDGGSTSVSGNRTSRVGVYLDCEAGILSFYSISVTKLALLHKVKTTFTQPLYPGLGVKDDGSQSSSGSYAELIKLW